MSWLQSTGEAVSRKGREHACAPRLPLLNPLLLDLCGSGYPLIYCYFPNARITGLATRPSHLCDPSYSILVFREGIPR